VTRSGGRGKKKTNGWGGARPGAGRKPNGEVAGVSHLRRARIDPARPVRVTLKMVKAIPDLRNKKVASIVKSAIEEGQDRFGFRVLHHTTERDRLTLIVEVKDLAALSRGMKSFNVRFARNLNRVLNRSGSVLADRYDSRTISSARELKNALRP
jgi:hypothetical protein